MTFQRICELAAARRCFDAGHPVSRIAKSAKRHPSTIYRWLRTTAQLGHRRTGHQETEIAHGPETSATNRNGR